jgi:hypothetical protein
MNAGLEAEQRQSSQVSTRKAYPRWRGLEGIHAAFGRTIPLKYRKCCICGDEAKRIGTIQSTWFRCDDELYPLCGPSNVCRDKLKEREGVAGQ